MAKRFALEPLLAYRTIKYDLARLDYAQATRHVQEQQAEIDVLRARDDRLAEVQNEALCRSPVDVLDVQRTLRQREAVRLSLEAAYRRLAELRVQAEAKRAIAVRAQQDKKVMERLRERFRQRQAREANRLEAVANDELATMQAARKERE